MFSRTTRHHRPRSSTTRNRNSEVMLILTPTTGRKQHHRDEEKRSFPYHPERQSEFQEHGQDQQHDAEGQTAFFGVPESPAAETFGVVVDRSPFHARRHRFQRPIVSSTALATSIGDWGNRPGKDFQFDRRPVAVELRVKPDVVKPIADRGRCRPA